MIKLLGTNNAKTIKGEGLGFLTTILYLAPAEESGVMNVCPFASKGCAAACLYTAGHASMNRKDGSNPIKEARIARTQFYFYDKEGFMSQLTVELEAFIKQAKKKELTPVIRLNGTSDLLWEKTGIMDRFSDYQFYDYTKIPKRAIDWANGLMPKNYHLTFSWNEEERNHEAAKEVAAVGGNVAVVFSKPQFPETFLDLPVVNGDKDDLRFLDPKGCVVGLKAKGKAKKDTTGFVVPV
jgi:hypothetical protein